MELVRPEQLHRGEAEARCFVDVIARRVVIVITFRVAIPATTVVVSGAPVVTIEAVGIAGGIIRRAVIAVAIVARLLLGAATAVLILVPGLVLILGLVLALITGLILILIPDPAVAHRPALSPFGTPPVGPVPQIGVVRFGIRVFRVALLCRRSLLRLLCRLTWMIRRF